MKNVLIDGTNLAHVHFAANPALDDNGNPIGIVKGFMNAVVRINRAYLPDNIIVFFDGKGGSQQRRELYKGYKEGRKPRTSVGQHYQFSSPEEAARNYDWQVDHLRDFLTCCGVGIIETEFYETDDGIAYFVSKNRESENIIVSCDKDFYQLLDENTKIYNPIAKSEVDCEYVLGKFGIHPANWLFYRSITGDPSDNIDGVKGFGPKTVQKMFQVDKIKSIPLSVIDDAIQVLAEEKLTAKEKTIQKRLFKLKENKDKLDRNWKLMDLRDPLLSQHSKESLDFQLGNFRSSLDTKTFYAKVSNLNIPLNPMVTREFVRLTNVQL